MPLFPIGRWPLRMMTFERDTVGFALVTEQFAKALHA